MKLLLRRTLVLKNRSELLAAGYELLYFAHGSQLMARSLLNHNPNLQECDSTGDAMKNDCPAHTCC